MSNQQSELKKLYELNLNETKRKIKDSVKIDNLIIQAINNIEELQKASNLLVKRLREWYSLYLPEIEHKIDDNAKFVEIILSKNKHELLKELNMKKEQSMGADLAEEDLEEIMILAEQVNGNYNLIDKHKAYLEKVMKRECPNMTEVCGALIGAQLIGHAGSIKKLATMTASTIQLLGAEKALFRHLRTGARVPKHGLIIQHPLVSQVKAKERGKVARAVADKVSMAVRVDFFKGEPVGKKYREELDKKFGK